MAYSVNWVTKVITIPQSDLTFLSGNNYSLDIADVHYEIRRLEWEFTDGLWAARIANFYETVTLSGVAKSPSLEIVNDYTFDFTGSNYNVILTGYDNNLVDVYIPSNGISILGNNSVGKITAGSGLLPTEQQQLGELWLFKGLDSSNPATISGDGETSSIVTVNGEVLTITPTSITRT